jgi:hypothetical protein
MVAINTIQRSTNHEIESDYRFLPLIKLIEKIVDNNDWQALAEFHNNRTLFYFNSRIPLLFINCLNELRKNTVKKQWSRRNASEIADMAYDLTLAKFVNLPDLAEPQSANDINEKKMKHKGADCRYYFSAYLKYLKKLIEKEQPSGKIEEELLAAKAMQAFVRRHFYFSCLEAKRKSNPFWSRYYWKVKGVKICVRLPVVLKGRKRQVWLKKNIHDPDPSKPNERRRIQSIIDRKLMKERFIPINEAIHNPTEDKHALRHDLYEPIEISIPKIVADEKAMNIQKQRRSIRVLGQEKLKQLILRVFQDISHDDYNDGKIARYFGLSKATFSRFAGSRWKASNKRIPDLWLNTAQVLSTHPDFKEAAKQAGVWEQVEIVLNKDKKKGTDNE